jgi:glycosyltransferase involved in cell wall biosynthesis
MTAGLEVSVVMATYNRAETLPETIACLDRQDLPGDEYEVIIVDDGSPDHTRSVVEELIPKVRFAMTYLRHDNRGPGYTQNRGIRQAMAPWVVLMADDIHMAPGALRAHLDAHQRHPGDNIAILGHVVQSPEFNATVFQRLWDPFRFDKLPAGVVLPFTQFWACNISFDRRFMLAHSMFREEMGPAGPAAHEDPEVGYRLWKAGLRVIHAKEPAATHVHPETLADAARRAYQRGLNWEYFFGLVPVPELPVRYHIYTWRNLKYHLRALRGANTEHLFVADDVGLGRLLLNLLVRPVLFNRLTVGLVWTPLINGADRCRWLARLVRPRMCRGVVAHWFFRGCADAHRQKRRLAARPRGPGGHGGPAGHERP